MSLQASKNNLLMLLTIDETWEPYTLSNQQQHHSQFPCDDIRDDNLIYCQSDTVGMNVDTFPLDDPKENISPNINSSEPDHQIDLQQIFKKHASTEMKLRYFEVNWYKVSDTIVQRLNNLQEFKNKNPKKMPPSNMRIAKTDLSALINAVVDQLRTIDTQIKAEIMECVAKKIFAEFPCLDFKDDDGFGGGNGYIAFKYKMISRNTYLNRCRDYNIPSATSTQIKKSRHVKACAIKEYWKNTSKECNPDILSKLVRNEPDILTTELLSESQGYIRYRLDEKKKLSLIISDFPVLRRRKLILYHFEQSTGTKATCLENYFLSKRNKLISFSKTRPQKLHLTETCTDVDIFKFICELVGVKWSELLCSKEIGTRLDDIQIDPPDPMLVEVDEGNTSMYYVYADETRLTEGTSDIRCAMTDFIATHFMYDFIYKKTISKFLEFIQQYFCKIISFEGSKPQTTRVQRQQRVVQKIIQAISNHE